MSKHPRPHHGPHPGPKPDHRPHPVRQHARAAIRVGPVRLRAELDLTATGLVAVGALVSSILLSSAAIVHVARRGRDRAVAPAP